MYLVDTNVISEGRKGPKANPGVTAFINKTQNELFLPVQVIGELRSGIERLRQRHDLAQALRVEAWFQSILDDASTRILSFDLHCAKMWGILMSANNQHPIDRQIAAIALVYDLTVATRNTDHFAGTGAQLINPFVADAPQP